MNPFGKKEIAMGIFANYKPLKCERWQPNKVRFSTEPKSAKKTAN